MTDLRTASMLLLVLGTAVMAERSCPAECSCPPAAPCPPGVSRVSDGCGCCKVCARQFNEACGEDEPCDHIKGLHCHLGAAGTDSLRGLCRAALQGRPCEFGGLVYQHGEDFQPGCTHQCSCMNGVVGCMPLCPQHAPLVPAWRCDRPRLVTPPGGCCEEWVCDDDNRVDKAAEGGAVRGPAPAHNSPQPPLHNHISPWLQAGPQPNYQEVKSLPKAEVALEPGCLPQTTEWTECSTTCGMGVSSRVTNDNTRCRLLRETRLCQIRHCDPPPPQTSKRGRKCQRTVRPQQPVRVAFAGCATARAYRPRTCGSCRDGRCCSPSLSRTVRLRFQCPDEGEGFWRDVMWIQRCSCRETCRPGGAFPWGHASSPALRLHNDIHTFQV